MFTRSLILGCRPADFSAEFCIMRPGSFTVESCRMVPDYKLFGNKTSWSVFCTFLIVAMYCSIMLGSRPSICRNLSHTPSVLRELRSPGGTAESEPYTHTGSYLHSPNLTIFSCIHALLSQCASICNAPMMKNIE